MRITSGVGTLYHAYSPSISQVLLEQKANMDLSNGVGQHPLSVALAKGYRDLSQILLNSSPEPEPALSKAKRVNYASRGYTPLHQARKRALSF